MLLGLLSWQGRVKSAPSASVTPKSSAPEVAKKNPVEVIQRFEPNLRDQQEDVIGADKKAANEKGTAALNDGSSQVRNVGVPGFTKPYVGDTGKDSVNVDHGVNGEDEKEVTVLGKPLSNMRDAKRSLPENFGMDYIERDDGSLMKTAGQANTQSGAALIPVVEGSKKINGRNLGQKTTDMAVMEREFAPFGRLVKVETVNTVDSLSPGSIPFIGLVMESLNWNGEVIIPANTEVHGLIKTEPKLDILGVGRLYDEGEFTLVLPRLKSRINGRELIVKGRIMDRREVLHDALGKPLAWSLDDLAPGLIGYTISTLENEEVKLFAAAFLGAAVKGVSGVLTSKSSAASQLTGTQTFTTQPTIGNALTEALGEGTSSAMDKLVDRLTESIKTKGIYVRVPAGKTVYLYIEQTIDPVIARVGARLPVQESSFGNSQGTQGAAPAVDAETEAYNARLAELDALTGNKTPRRTSGSSAQRVGAE
jgi:hypothetical protein